MTPLLGELLDNAFKYSRAGTAVRLVGRCHEQTYQLTLTDYRRGLTAGQIAEVGAYRQFDRKRYEQQGSGLGLAIARRIVELHGGEFSIESVPGEHTTVNVTLPV